MSTVTRTAGVAGKFPYRLHGLSSAPFAAPRTTIFADAAKTIVAVPEQADQPTGQLHVWDVFFPAALAAGSYPLRTSTVITQGENPFVDDNDTLVLLPVSGSVGLGATLATVEDLEIYMQRDLADVAATAELALSLATGVIQSEAKQRLLYQADHTVTLYRARDDLLQLPESPVVAVAAVTDDETALANTDWRRFGGVLRRVDRSWIGPVTVTYSHGYQTIPDELRGLCLQLAARIVDNPQGERSEQIGNYSVTRAGDGFGLVLTEDERRVARRFRRRAA